MGDRCQAKTRFKPLKYGENHTIQCEKEPGHDGAHCWRRDTREVSWYGPVKELQDNTRWRHGLAPGWLNE